MSTSSCTTCPQVGRCPIAGATRAEYTENATATVHIISGTEQHRFDTLKMPLLPNLCDILHLEISSTATVAIRQAVFEAAR